MGVIKSGYILNGLDTRCRIIIVYNNGCFECYHELADYGITEYAFSLEGQEAGLSVDSENEEDIRKCVMKILTSNIDNMYWGRILKAYLEEKGIEYEEEQEEDSLTEVVNKS